MKLLCGFPHAAFASDGPEIAQVMIIQPFHSERYIAEIYQSNRIPVLVEVTAGTTMLHE
jgi:hypothetical protein